MLSILTRTGNAQFVSRQRLHDSLSQRHALQLEQWLRAVHRAIVALEPEVCHIRQERRERRKDAVDPCALALERGDEDVQRAHVCTERGRALEEREELLAAAYMERNGAEEASTSVREKAAADERTRFERCAVVVQMVNNVGDKLDGEAGETAEVPFIISDAESTFLSLLAAERRSS